jgi:chorismate lyase / 3-hydroxybenzoate synthase
MPKNPASGSALRGTFETLDPSRPLDDDVLTAIVFGSDTPCPSDLRAVRIDLEPLAGSARSEVWRGRGPARIGTAGPIRHVENGEVFAGWMSLDESRFGGLLEATEAAYLGLLRLHADSPYQHVWRVWNFVAAINEGNGDCERYRQFCLGRARAFAATQARSPGIRYPAASAVGKRTGPRSLQVCWIAGREPGAPLENPRQVSAYHYPRQYGPAPPSFSRAMAVPGRLLLISGTASIVGHASLHDEDLAAQLHESLMNLDALLSRAQASGQLQSAKLDATGLVKAYVRQRSDAAAVERALRERLGETVPILILAADICRPELLVEIEVAHQG